MQPADADVADWVFLQSNTQLQQTLTQMGLQQAIGSSGNLIGKKVSGLDASGTKVDGNVVSIAVKNQQVNLELDSGKELPMQNVIGIMATKRDGGGGPGGECVADFGFCIPGGGESGDGAVPAECDKFRAIADDGAERAGEPAFEPDWTLGKVGGTECRCLISCAA